MSTDQKSLSRWNKRGMDDWFCVRADVKLNRGRVSDVFTVDGACRIVCMFMEITEAMPAGTVQMGWIFDSDKGGFRNIAASGVDIAPSALGDFYVAELDGTTPIQVTTSVGLINGYWYENSATNGIIVTNGGIDISLSNMTLAAGKGTLYIYYKPLMFNSCIYTGVVHTSTTSSTTSTTTSSTTSSTTTTTSTTSTTSSTSSTSSTASTTSTTSSTSSTSSTASTTSSTSSTSSTASTSSTSSTASTTSSTSSTSSTASTTSSTSSTSSTASTTSSTSSTSSTASSTSSSSSTSSTASTSSTSSTSSTASTTSTSTSTTTSTTTTAGAG